MNEAQRKQNNRMKRKMRRADHKAKVAAARKRDENAFGTSAQALADTILKRG